MAVARSRLEDVSAHLATFLRMWQDSQPAPSCWGVSSHDAPDDALQALSGDGQPHRALLEQSEAEGVVRQPFHPSAAPLNPLPDQSPTSAKPKRAIETVCICFPLCVWIFMD